MEISRNELLKFLKLGKSGKLVGFNNLPSLSKLKVSELNKILRKSILIQLNSRFGGNSPKKLSDKSESELIKMLNRSNYKKHLTEKAKGTDSFFVSSPDNFIIYKDKRSIRELSNSELSTLLNELKKRNKINTPALTREMVYRQAKEKNLKTAELKELCKEKGLPIPKTKSELQKICLKSSDISRFIKLTTVPEEARMKNALITECMKIEFFSDSPSSLFVTVPLGKIIHRETLSDISDLTIKQLEKTVKVPEIKFDFTTHQLIELL